MPRIGPFSRGAMRLKVTSKIAINVKAETLIETLLIRDALAFLGFEAVQLMAETRPSRDFSPKFKQNLSGLIGFFRHLRSKS